jgi:hypothetical protein
VTGDNRDGMATPVCTLTVYDYTGTVFGQIGFQSSGSRYDILSTLPAAQLGYLGLHRHDVRSRGSR